MNHQQTRPQKRDLDTYDIPEPKRPQRRSIYEQFPQLRDPDKKLIAPPVILLVFHLFTVVTDDNPNLVKRE